jgi:hypothetical protein
MPATLRLYGQRYGKHAIVSSIPVLWDWGLKRFFRSIHEKISPCTNCAERDNYYDTMYDHLRTSSAPTEKKDIIKNVSTFIGADFTPPSV